MQQLEGLEYTTELYLNMGYYTIRVSPAIQDMKTINNEFGKFRYNRLPMGMCASVDIFQAKVDKILGDIEGVKMQIYDILVLSKDKFENNIDQIRIIFGRLRDAGLKVNAPKCSFGLKDIPYLGYLITREGIKPDPKKVKGIMDIGRPATNTESRALICMVQYYRDMWPKISHVLAPLTEAASGPKGRKILRNDGLEISFKELKRRVSAETLLSYPDWKLLFIVHTDAYDKKLGAVISQNKKPIAFFSRRLSKPQRNYTKIEKELLAIVECLKQFQGIIFGYEINVFSDQKNPVYAATLSEYQRVMHWRIILEYCGHNIQHISRVDNIVANTLIRLPSTPSNKYKTCTSKAQCRTNKLLTIGRVENNEYCFPLSILIVNR